MTQVGGGPTGVELAAEMHDYIKEDLTQLFPSLKVTPHPLLSKGTTTSVSTTTSLVAHCTLRCFYVCLIVIFALDESCVGVVLSSVTDNTGTCKAGVAS